jgi:hypothetical protein
MSNDGAHKMLDQYLTATRELATLQKLQREAAAKYEIVSNRVEDQLAETQRIWTLLRTETEQAS